ncbi:hypothetical protein LSCM1_03214 [Leishmania martiniquensis]|uniref:Methyltransferase n=1 Tax=Leishmania martiniquensis TaxID=1580590 RepID=A0A836G3J3_9TRYP|nr:hypothetical protein LSCM1_03214 [Leishmania martiniquensis]
MRERPPPIAPSLCDAEHTFPLSLILFLQSAPPNIVLSAFQADCESRHVSWCSAEGQMLAAEWFVQHPAVKKYPPRLRMVRTLLKAYITSVEEQYGADGVLSSASSEDLVRTELMEEFIRVNVCRGVSAQELCFKTFCNPFVVAPGIPTTKGPTNAPVLPSGSPMLQCATPTPPLAYRSMANSSPTQERPTSADSLQYASLSPGRYVSSAQRLLQSRSESTHPHSPHYLPPGIVTNGDSEMSLITSSVGSPSTSPPKGSPTRHQHAQQDQQQRLSTDLLAQTSASASAAAAARVLGHFSAIRVSHEQFSNVGLSLWPAAFVMVQLLAQELKGQTHMLADVLGLPRVAGGSASSTASLKPSLRAPNSRWQSHAVATSPAPGSLPDIGLRSSAPKPHSSQLRILELGAGAGLTPVYLHHMEEYKKHVASFLATDYQETIVDNMRFNMAENGIRLVSSSLRAKDDEWEGHQRPPLHRAALLDWMNHDANERMLKETEVDVTLVADCVYDADVIPALVDTIHLALTSRGTASSATAGGLQKQRCCIVVQTHRQNTTMEKFFSAVRVFGQVRSYTLVRRAAGSLRMSQDHSGADGGCIPLGDWNEESVSVNPDRVVCALVPDVVLEDGSMRYASRCQHSDKVKGTATAAEDRLALLSAPPVPPRASPGTPVTANAVTGSPTPLQRSKSASSTDSQVPTSQSTSSVAHASATAEALLADAMIGPFYTSMVGLIGVHVITLKPAKATR